jgi:hypothetical protein
LVFLKIILPLAMCWTLAGQEIGIYSEFQRFDPHGRVVAQDREPRPREILSPAVPRNGHLSVQVVVTAPSGTNYFLYAGSNPPDTVRLTVYREHFVPCGDDYCPDWLTPQPSPSFGAIPESLRDMPDQTTRCYLLDIWVPPDVPPRRIRIEALLKVGVWVVAPMEIRVIAPTVPDTLSMPAQEDVAPVDAPSGATAQTQLLRYLNGLPPEAPPGLLTARDVIQRNAAEDMWLAESLHIRVPEMNQLAWAPFVFPELGAEWYLRVRDFIYRFSPDE